MTAVPPVRRARLRRSDAVGRPRPLSPRLHRTTHAAGAQVSASSRRPSAARPLGATLEASRAGDRPATRPRTRSGTRSPPTPDRSIIIALDAEGDLDATIDVYERERSQVTPVGLQEHEPPRRGDDRDRCHARDVVLRSASARARTRPTIASGCASSTPDPPASFPGAGCRARASPPWSTGSRIPTTPGPSTSARHDVPAELRLVRRPVRDSRALRQRGSAAIRSAGCAATPTPSSRRSANGTYSVLVARAARLARAADLPRPRRPRAGADDTAPGIRLANDVRVRAGICRATSSTRSTCTGSRSRARANCGSRSAPGKDFDLRLMTDTGHRIACECGSSGSKEIERRMQARPLLRRRARARRRRGQIRAAAAGARDHARTHARRRRRAARRSAPGRA